MGLSCQTYLAIPVVPNLGPIRETFTPWWTNVVLVGALHLILISKSFNWRVPSVSVRIEKKKEVQRYISDKWRAGKHLTLHRSTSCASRFYSWNNLQLQSWLLHPTFKFDLRFCLDRSSPRRGQCSCKVQDWHLQNLLSTNQLGLISGYCQVREYKIFTFIILGMVNGHRLSCPLPIMEISWSWDIANALLMKQEIEKIFLPGILLASFRCERATREI